MKHLLVLCMVAGCEHGQSPTDAMPNQDGIIIIGDGGSGACGVGSGTVNGVVGGVEVSPVVRASQVTIPDEGTAIIIDEAPGACGETTDVGEHLIIVFCDPPAVGTHPIVDVVNTGLTCPGGDPAALVEQNGGIDFALSTGGSVTITASDGNCTTGTFSVDLMPDVGSPGTFSGSFSAVVCP